MAAVIDPPTLEDKKEIVERMWPATSTLYPSGDSEHWNAFFAFYTKQCRDSSFGNEGDDFWPRTHFDLTRCAEALRADKPRSDVKQILKDTIQIVETGVADQKVEGTLVATAQLLAMIKIGDSGQQRDQVQWDNARSLSQAAQSHFGRQQYFDPELVLDSDFTAQNIEHVTKIGVEWTDNLAEHLCLVDSNRKVRIFHHVTFLKRMGGGIKPELPSAQAVVPMAGPPNAIALGDLLPQQPIFDDEFVKQTLDTLRLIFPNTHAKTRKWLDELCPPGSEPPFDLGLREIGHISRNESRLERFSYWGERLEILHNHVELRTHRRFEVMKTLRNRKDPNWLTAWAAVIAALLTVFFGLVQSVEGAIQVYKAYHPATD